MDHFHVTVQKDGHLVSTRRGMQVSKTKYHGLSFVNASCPAPASQPAKAQVHTFSAFAEAGNNGNSSSSNDASKPLTHRWKFVTRSAASGDGPAAKPKSGVRRSSPTTSETSTASVAAASPDCDAEFITPSAAALQDVVPFSCADSHNRQPARHPAKHAAKRTRKARGHSSSSSNNSNSSAGNELAVSRSLPTWKTCRIPTLSEGEQLIFHQVFQLVPRKIYPFEDLLQYNPSRSSEFYWMVAQDRAAVRCVMMCGAMFRAVLSGAADSQDLALEVSRVCGIVNDQLARYQRGNSRDSRDGNGLVSRNGVPTMTLECIATLALMGGFTGRYDHWHMHMRGLKKLVELVSDRRDGRPIDGHDMNRLPPSLLAKMRKTDLKGAIALATTPYLPFARIYPNVSDAVLRPAERDALLLAVLSLLSPYDPARAAVGSIGNIGIRPVVVDAVAQLCVFVRAVLLASARVDTADAVPLDPYGFAEELHWVQYVLVSRPGPLRQDGPSSSSSSSSNAITDGSDIGRLPLDASRLHTEDIVRNHRAPLMAVVPTPLTYDDGGSTTTFLEPALRIAALLYLKECIPDFPRNLGGYGVLLALLRTHLGRDDLLTPPPSLESGDTPYDQDCRRSQRAVLLWLCLVGDIVSRIADANERRAHPADRYDRRVFRDGLVQLVKSSDGGEEGGVDGLPDSDWALCRLLPLDRVQPGWDDRAGVQQILATW